jgi:hypothetical protein
MKPNANVQDIATVEMGDIAGCNFTVMICTSK